MEVNLNYTEEKYDKEKGEKCLKDYDWSSKENKDMTEDYDEEKTKNAIKNIGNGKIPKVLSLDYSKLVPYLIKMVQIQQNEVDKLKDRIVALKELIEYWQW